jgi:predicted 2-oxoglutarate/Fe(II)-dependent dioxygenase YbiX
MLSIRWHAKDIGTIDGFFTPQECSEAIAFSEGRGYADAPVTTNAGMVMMKDVRNNERVMLDDPARAQTLFSKISPFVPVPHPRKWVPVGLNERLRFYRYDVGQQFDWHLDGYFERANGDRSFFTFMVYLNAGFDGGETSFVIDKSGLEILDIKPEAGMALLFRHRINHKGQPVRSGRKYVLRTDVMYGQPLLDVFGPQPDATR